jgi:hypothetical protein
VEIHVDADPSGVVVGLSRAEAVVEEAEEEEEDFEAQAEAAIEDGEATVEEVVTVGEAVTAEGVVDETRAVDVDAVVGLRRQELQSQKWMTGKV